MTEAQLVANFSATPVAGCAPLVVQFSDASTGSPTSWVWDMGNGNISSAKNPSTIYFNPGTYTVKLVVRSSSGADSVVKANYIVVYAKPTINFSATDTIGCIPHSVRFTDASTAGSGTITQWQWDFGDGNTSTQQSPSNTFVSAGNYNITLRVINSGGCDTIISKVAYVRVASTPLARFTTSTSSGCNPPTTVNFSNTSAGTGTLSYAWRFGDGGTSTSANPSHTYTTSGVFRVVLTTTNQNGCKDSTAANISVGSVTPAFIAPDTVCVNSGFNISNTSSPATFASNWTFGDGTTATTINPFKIYTTPGNYTIKLVNNFGGCTDSVSKPIVVRTAPTATFSNSLPVAACKAPLTVSFTSGATGATSYSWSFGDGGTSNQPNPTYTYTTLGSFSVKLIVRNANGCADSLEKPNLIVLQNPSIASISGLPFRGCVPFSSTFIPAIISSDPVVSYSWNFGDGGTSTQNTPSHTYAVPGVYAVSLNITTASGCAASINLPDGVKVGVRPAASFTATPTTACAYQSVSFTNTTPGVTDFWQWSFGDTTSSSSENPIHDYVDTGLFTVTFIVGSNGCNDTLKKINLIYIKPPVARFTVRNYCDTPYTKRFTDRSKGAVTYLWDFGDATTSTQKNPAHTYAAPGRYIVKLRVDNAPCYDEYTDTVLVVDENPGISATPVSVCKNTPVTLTATGLNAANVRRYVWIYGDGSPSDSGALPTVTHQYASAGNFTPTLRTIDRLGCSKSTTLTSALSIYGPSARLSKPLGGCANSNLVFTDQSQPYSSYALVEWYINYGDGTSVTTATPVFSHAYSATGAYNIVFAVKDSYGCVDTLRDTIPVTITQAVADILLFDSVKCRQSLVNFSSNAVGQGLSYLWDFGDGSSSPGRTPTHIYTADGLYTISLKVTDQYGCSDSIAKPNAIRIANVSAGFAMSDTLVVCPPSLVRFTSQSANYASLKWDFDDGGSASIANPTHFFIRAGLYNVKLVAYGFGTCVDSVVRPLRVRGPQGNITYTPLGQCAPALVTFNGNASNITGTFTWDFGDGTTQVATGNTITHTYTAVGRYLPKLLLRDATINCVVAVFGADTISVSGAKALIAVPALTYCDSTTIAFRDSSIIQYDSVTSWNWTFSNGGTSTQQNPVRSFTTPGTYTVGMSLNTKYGCKDTAVPVTIKVVKSPDVNISGNSNVCVRDTISFVVNLAQPDTSATQYQWAFGNGNTGSSATPPRQIYAVEDTLNVQVIAVNSSGCRDTAIHPLIVRPLPVINAGVDSLICRGQSIALAAIGGSSYLWQPNKWLSCTACSSPVAMPDSSITYVVAGTSTFGCKSNDTVSITVVQPFNTTAGPIDTICKGQSANLTASGANQYVWSPAATLSNANVANPVASPLITTNYMVVGNDQYGCFTDTAYSTVVVYDFPTFDIVPETVTVNPGSGTPIPTSGSSDITTYNWQPAVGLSCNNCPQPVANPLQTTVYTGIASNAGGCTSKDVVTVLVVCSLGNLYVPNTFSPNADGSNDVFYPRGKGISGIRNFVVYNRWGVVMYQRSSLNANDAGAGWDGTYKGQPASQDVYVYHMEVYCSGGEKIVHKGDVTLIR